MTDSRLPGFYKLSVDERRRLVSERSGEPLDALVAIVEGGGIDTEQADKIVENVLGTYRFPFGLALNFRINDADRLVPMVVEEPSVVAAASNAAKMVRAGGGFSATMVEDLMTTQVQLHEVPDPELARAALEDAREELLQRAAHAVPNLIRRGGGPRDLEVRDLGDGVMVVHIHVDCRDAMGANLVNTIAEALGPRCADLAGGRLGLRILTNLSDRRRVRVTCRVPGAALAGKGAATATEVVAAVAQASRFAEKDPYRAATHNKGLMNGVDAVVLATGNDWRAVEAGAHAFAARGGQYGPLATWRATDDGDALEGTLDIPMALGIVGGTLRVHPAARLALRLAGVTSAADLAMVVAAAGMASNLAAIRALAMEGIQRGHMSLHARSVAAAAGATGPEVEAVAAVIVAAGTITVDAAGHALAQHRASAASRAGESS